MLRLTLRTLLAWLDDVLPAEEAGAFSEKLASSGAAKVFVDRIRAVVAHPGLDAPKVVGRGLAADANSVAEYLTNSLAADSVAAFERVCIESDAHLAEVASCHRMLVEARNDPRIFEPPEPDELARLLAKTGSPTGPAGTASKTHEIHPAEAVAVRDGKVSRSPSPRRAEASKTSGAAWASVIAAVLLVAALAGTLVWRLALNGLGGSMPTNPDAVALRDAARNAAPSEEGAATASPVEPPPGEAEPSKPAPTEQEPLPASLAASTPPIGATPAGTPSTNTPPAPPEPSIAVPSPESQPGGPQKSPEGRVPGGEALAIAAKPASPQGAVAEPAAAPPPAPVEQRPADDEMPFVSVGKAPLVLERVGETGGPADWAALAAGASLAGSADLLVPEGFAPTLMIGNATIRLIGPARAVLRAPAGDEAEDEAKQDDAQEFELVFGRAVVGGIGGGRSLSFAAGELTGRLEGGDPIGLEVRFERAAGSDPQTVPSKAVGSIAFPAGGRVAFQPEIAAGMPGPMEGGLIRPDGSIAPGVVVAGRGVASRGLPDWLASASPPRLLDRLAAEAMAASLSAAPTPDALERLLDHSRLENRSAAAATMAVMGRYEPLVELLAAEEPGRRLPARAWETLERATVPFALARGPASAGRLLAALERAVPPDDGKLVRQLAIGFSDEAVASGGDAVLVACLEHPSLLVRRMAAARLLETVPLAAADRLRYRPDGSEAARAEAVKWWRGQLEKGRIRGAGEGGLSKAAGE